MITGNILKMSFLKGSQPTPKPGNFHFSKQEKNSSQLPPGLPSSPPRPFSSQNPTYFTTRACPGAALHVLGGVPGRDGPPRPGQQQGTQSSPRCQPRGEPNSTAGTGGQLQASSLAPAQPQRVKPGGVDGSSRFRAGAARRRLVCHGEVQAAAQARTSCIFFT